MKKRIAMMCIAGVMAFSLCACGDKSKEASTETASQTAEGTSEDSNGSLTEEAATEETRVSERADYVPLEDLEVADYVTIPDYKSMTVQVARTEVTDKTIEDYINKNILSAVPVKDRAVANGDVVTIDFEGKKDGVAFDGGTSKGYQLEIGSGTFIPGFEDGLIGVNNGETVDLNLTFPENYNNKELAGQDVVFTVTVKNILESVEYSGITPEQLKSMDYDSKEALWEEAKKTVEEENEESYQTNIINSIMEQLMNESQVTSVPQPLVDEAVQNYNRYMEFICASYYGCDLETYISYMQMTMDEYNEKMNTMMEEQVKQNLILEAIAREEDIVVSEDEIMKQAEAEAQEYGYGSAEEMLDEVGKSTYRMSMLQEEVINRLKDIVTVETVTAQEEQEETEDEPTTKAE